MKQRKLLIVLSLLVVVVGSDKKMGGCAVSCDDDEGRHQQPGAVRLTPCYVSWPGLSVISTITDQEGTPPTPLHDYDYSTVSHSGSGVSNCPYSGSCAGPTLDLSHLCYADFIIYFVCHTDSHGQTESALLSKCHEGCEV